jgi:hypothetical protein
MTIDDFSQIFDSYAEFEESIIAKWMNKRRCERNGPSHGDPDGHYLQNGTVYYYRISCGTAGCYYNPVREGLKY